MVLVGKNDGAVVTNAIKQRGKTFVKPNSDEAFAEINFKEGSKRRHEFTRGGGYLSQSSNIIEVVESIKSVAFYSVSGQQTRKLSFD